MKKGIGRIRKIISGNAILKWFIFGSIMGAIFGTIILLSAKYPKIEVVNGEEVITAWVPLLQASPSFVLNVGIAGTIGMVLSLGFLTVVMYAVYTGDTT